MVSCFLRGFPGGSVVENLLANAEDPGSIPGLGRSPGEGNGNPLQYSCLENPTDRGFLKKNLLCEAISTFSRWSWSLSMLCHNTILYNMTSHWASHLCHGDIPDVIY